MANTYITLQNLQNYDVKLRGVMDAADAKSS